MKVLTLFSGVKAVSRFRRCLKHKILPAAVMALAMVSFPISGFADKDDHRGWGYHKFVDKDDQRGWSYHRKGATILDKLERTDGTQALLAAIRVIDSSSVCSPIIEELLDNRKKRLVVLAPNNRAFEKFLILPEGGFDGMSTETIALALPGILNRLDLNAEDVCKVLLKHIAERKDAKRLTARELLEEGEITVLGSDLPIAVGDVGPLVNFEASITERDVFTVNGVIHYLNNVIVDAEEPPQPPTNEVCNQEKCFSDPEQRAQCENFLAACLAANEPEEECVGGGLLICNEPEFEFEPEPPTP